jgi:hypothetical protein
VNPRGCRHWAQAGAGCDGAQPSGVHATASLRVAFGEKRKSPQTFIRKREKRGRRYQWHLVKPFSMRCARHLCVDEGCHSRRSFLVKKRGSLPLVESSLVQINNTYRIRKRGWKHSSTFKEQPKTSREYCSRTVLLVLNLVPFVSVRLIRYFGFRGLELSRLFVANNFPRFGPELLRTCFSYPEKKRSGKTMRGAAAFPLRQGYGGTRGETRSTQFFQGVETSAQSAVKSSLKFVKFRPCFFLRFRQIESRGSRGVDSSANPKRIGVWHPAQRGALRPGSW